MQLIWDLNEFSNRWHYPPCFLEFHIRVHDGVGRGGNRSLWGPHQWYLTGPKLLLNQSSFRNWGGAKCQVFRSKKFHLNLGICADRDAKCCHYYSGLGLLPNYGRDCGVHRGQWAGLPDHPAWYYQCPLLNGRWNPAVIVRISRVSAGQRGFEGSKAAFQTYLPLYFDCRRLRVWLSFLFKRHLV